MKKAVLFTISVTLLLPALIFAGGLTEQNLPKLKRLAEMFAFQIVGGDPAQCRLCHTGTEPVTKTVAVEDFKGAVGRPTKEGTEMAEEFMRQLTATGLMVVAGREKADVVISGTLIPFKGRKKWQIKLNAVTSDTGRVILSYDGVVLQK